MSEILQLAMEWIRTNGLWETLLLLVADFVPGSVHGILDLLAPYMPLALIVAMLDGWRRASRLDRVLPDGAPWRHRFLRQAIGVLGWTAMPVLGFVPAVAAYVALGPLWAGSLGLLAGLVVVLPERMTRRLPVGWPVLLLLLTLLVASYPFLCSLLVHRVENILLSAEFDPVLSRHVGGAMKWSPVICWGVLVPLAHWRRWFPFSSSAAKAVFLLLVFGIGLPFSVVDYGYLLLMDQPGAVLASGASPDGRRFAHLEFLEKHGYYRLLVKNGRYSLLARPVAAKRFDFEPGGPYRIQWTADSRTASAMSAGGEVIRFTLTEIEPR